MSKYKIRLISGAAIVATIFAGNFLWAKTGSAPPVAQIKDISLSRDQSVAYILNGDGTVSAYDLSKENFIFSRISLVGAINPRRILVDPENSALALVDSVGAKDLRISIYRIELTGEGKERLSLGPSYLLGAPTAQGALSMVFSQDGKTLFAGFGMDALHILSSDKQEQAQIVVGELPRAIATDSAGMVLVANEKSGSLSIVDPLRKALRATVKLGSSPREILFNTVTNRAYVAHVGSDDVYVVDTAAARVVRVIKVGADPTSLAYDKENGTVFVANSTSGTLSVIPPTFEVKTVDLKSPTYAESTPLKLAYLNGGKKLFILNTAEAKYLVYNAEQGQIIKEGRVDIFPTEIFISEKSKSVIALHWNANSLFIIDAETLTVGRTPDSATAVEAFFSKPQSIAIDATANRIFISNLGGDYITVIDGNTQRPIAKIKVSRSVQTVFLNKSTRKLYAVSPPDNTFTVIDISKDNYPTKTVQLAQQPRGGAINETTNRIYYSNSATGELSVVDGSKDEVIATVSFAEKSFPLVSSVDESRNKIYVALYGGSSIAVVDGERNEVEKLIPVGTNPIWVRYLPNIDRVLVSVEAERKILSIDPNGNQIVQTLSISGKPYRIFFDSTTGYVYVNRRGEDVVTILRPAEASRVFEIVGERFIQYWGETDRRYNMVGYNEKTELVYFTLGATDQTIVVKAGHDDQNVIQGAWYATINADGNVIYSPEARDELDRASGKSILGRISRFNVGIGALVILLLVVALILFKRRASQSLS